MAISLVAWGCASHVFHRPHRERTAYAVDSFWVSFLEARRWQNYDMLTLSNQSHDGALVLEVSLPSMSYAK